MEPPRPENCMAHLKWIWHCNPLNCFCINYFFMYNRVTIVSFVHWIIVNDIDAMLKNVSTS